MGRPTVFISHAGGETKQAREVAGLLEQAGVPVILDAYEVGPGTNFVDFMETGIHDADYFLLLWSRMASDGSYVKAEWQAAYAREVKLCRAFMIVARLEDHPPPTLLRPRAYVDLFPVISTGVDALIAMFDQDRRIGADSAKAMTPSPAVGEVVPSAGDIEVYVTSDLFDVVVPIRAISALPAGLLVAEVIKVLRLRSRLAVRDHVGIDIDYRLRYQDRLVDRSQSLMEQDITEGVVLTLEVSIKDFSRVPVVATEPGDRRVYRDPSDQDKAQLLEELVRIGLRRRRETAGS